MVEIFGKYDRNGNTIEINGNICFYSEYISIISIVFLLYFNYFYCISTYFCIFHVVIN